MTVTAIRVVHEHIPYLVVSDEDGSVARVHGPFAPGTEPHLADCTVENQVRDASAVEAIVALAAVSPELPPTESTLASGRPSESPPRTGRPGDPTA